MSSVKRINEAVQKIIQCSTPYMKRTNIYYACAELMAANDVLREYFEKDDFEQTELDRLKDLVYTEYIRLEYAISEFNKDYEKSYIKRNRIVTAKDDIRKIVLDDNIDIETRQEAFILMGPITTAYLKLNDIDIYISDEELTTAEKFIKERTKDV